MSINPLNKAAATEAYNKTSSNRKNDREKSAPTEAPKDQLEISPEATLVAKAHNAEAANRHSVVDRIKTEISEETYVTQQKLANALDSAIDQTLSGL